MVGLMVFLIYLLKLDPLSWDAVVTVIVVIVAGVISLALYVVRQTEPGRTYNLVYQQHPETAKYSGEEKLEPVAVEGGGHATLYVHITARRPISVSALSFRLVERRFRPHWLGIWRMIAPHPSAASVNNVWDNGWELENKPRSFGTGEPQPTARLNENHGYTVRYASPKDLLVGDSLWYRVIVGIADMQSKGWQGLLEFQGPSSAGHPVYKRRKVRIEKSTPREQVPDAQ